MRVPARRTVVPACTSLPAARTLRPAATSSRVVTVPAAGSSSASSSWQDPVGALGHRGAGRGPHGLAVAEHAGEGGAGPALADEAQGPPGRAGAHGEAVHGAVGEGRDVGRRAHIVDEVATERALDRDLLGAERPDVGQDVGAGLGDRAQLGHGRDHRRLARDEPVRAATHAPSGGRPAVGRAPAATGHPGHSSPPVRAGGRLRGSDGGPDGSMPSGRTGIQ